MDALETYELLKYLYHDDNSSGYPDCLQIKLANIKEFNEVEHIELDFEYFMGLIELIIFLDDFDQLKSMKLKNTPKIVQKGLLSSFNNIKLSIESLKTTSINFSYGYFKDLNIRCPNVEFLNLQENYLTNIQIQGKNIDDINLRNNIYLQNVIIESKSAVHVNLKGNKLIKDLEINKIKELSVEQGLLFTKINNVYKYLDVMGRNPILIQESNITKDLF